MADESSHSELIASFSGLTGADANRAQFYLESAAWKLDVAVASFFEEDEPMEEAPFNPAEPQPAGTRPPAPSRFGNIAGLASHESDSDEGEAYYAGGSERGAGQQIIGPPKDKPSTDKFVKEMFKAAREHGAEEVTAGSSSGNTSVRSVFRGTGYRLGDTDGPPEAVSGFAAPSRPPSEVDMVLKLWKTGFSIDDGELREFSDPENKQFLDSIKNGEIPRELTRKAKGGVVNLNMEDHHTEDFVKPKVNLKAFSGQGHTLGSPTPSVASPSAAAGASAQSAAASNLKIDESKPVTTLQIRLSDGKRLVAKFNHTHTVADVRQHIISTNPQFAAATFVLMTTFPKKDLEDETATLTALGLLNSVLVQRLT